MRKPRVQVQMLALPNINREVLFPHKHPIAHQPARFALDLDRRVHTARTFPTCSIPLVILTRGPNRNSAAARSCRARTADHGRGDGRDSACPSAVVATDCLGTFQELQAGPPPRIRFACDARSVGGVGWDAKGASTGSCTSKRVSRHTMPRCHRRGVVQYI